MTVEEFFNKQQEMFEKQKKEQKQREELFIKQKCKELHCKRLAKCTECGKLVASGEKLPFLEKRPNDKCDRFYCGCNGWE